MQPATGYFVIKLPKEYVIDGMDFKYSVLVRYLCSRNDFEITGIESKMGVLARIDWMKHNELNDYLLTASKNNYENTVA